MKQTLYAAVVAASVGALGAYGAVVGRQTGGGEPAPSPPESFLRVHLHPEPVRFQNDSDYNTWTVPTQNDITNASTTISGVDFTLSSPDGVLLNGNSYKFNYAQFLPVLGQRNVNEGLSTAIDEDGSTSHPLSLSITGLAAGNHTLLSWHNAWDKIEVAATIDVSINGKIVVSVRTHTMILTAYFKPNTNRTCNKPSETTTSGRHQHPTSNLSSPTQATPPRSCIPRPAVTAEPFSTVSRSMGLASPIRSASPSRNTDSSALSSQTDQPRPRGAPLRRTPPSSITSTLEQTPRNLPLWLWA